MQITLCLFASNSAREILDVYLTRYHGFKSIEESILKRNVQQILNVLEKLDTVEQYLEQTLPILDTKRHSFRRCIWNSIKIMARRHIASC